MCSARKGRRARRCFDSSAWKYLQHKVNDFKVCSDSLLLFFGSRKSRIMNMSSSESVSNGLFEFCCCESFCFFMVMVVEFVVL